MFSIGTLVHPIIIKLYITIGVSRCFTNKSCLQKHSQSSLNHSPHTYIIHQTSTKTTRTSVWRLEGARSREKGRQLFLFQPSNRWRHWECVFVFLCDLLTCFIHIFLDLSGPERPMYVNQQVKSFLAKGLVINYGKRGLQNRSGGGGGGQVKFYPYK